MNGNDEDQKTEETLYGVRETIVREAKKAQVKIQY